MSEIDVIMGTPICRRASFVLDKFLSNQREIQQAYPGCALILATDEPDFVTELKEQVNLHRLRGEVITYETLRPDYAKSKIWSIAAGREALRQYVLSQGAEYLLFQDGDMVYETSVVSTMKSKIKGFEVVYSGYRLPPYGVWTFGGGCLMINRKILSKIAFRCFEFKNGQIINEDTAFDMDLISHHARVNTGIFLSIKHYVNSQEYYAIEPQPVGWFRALTKNLLLRYVLTKISILARFNIVIQLGPVLDRILRVKPPTRYKGD